MSLHSPFSHRLRKNYIAQPDEEVGIKKVIETQQAIIRELDLELGEIKKATMALIAKSKALADRRENHQTFVRDHKALLSGMLHLPVDILLEIFMDLAPEDKELTTPHPIIRIAHVCRHWRDIALSSPMLWTTLQVDGLSLPHNSGADLQESEGRMARLADMLSTLISRSAGFPMTLNMSEDDPTFPSVMPIYGRSVVPIVNVLREARWEKIRLHLFLCQPDSPLLQLLQIAGKSYETLREAEIILTIDKISIAQDVVSCLNLERMEQLSVLHLDLPHLSPLEVRIRWDVLSELTLYTPLPAHEVFKVLTQSRNLTQFTVGLPHSPPTSQFLYPPHSVILPRLHTLRLVGETKELAHSLVLPALRSLDMINTLDGLDLPFDIVTPQWLRNYGTQLTHISFNYWRQDVSTLLSSLEDISAATSLEIGPYPPTEGHSLQGPAATSLHLSVLHALTPKRDEPRAANYLCAKLEKVIIHAPDVKTKIEDWVEFISSRRGGMQASVTFLKSVEIRFHDQDDRGRATVASTHVEVRQALTRMGVSVDGIDFRVELDTDA